MGERLTLKLSVPLILTQRYHCKRSFPPAAASGNPGLPHGIRGCSHHKHQHGLWWQHGSKTSAWTPDTNMVFFQKMNHSSSRISRAHTRRSRASHGGSTGLEGSIRARWARWWLPAARRASSPPPRQRCCVGQQLCSSNTNPTSLHHPPPSFPVPGTQFFKSISPNTCLVCSGNIVCSAG